MNAIPDVLLEREVGPVQSFLPAGRRDIQRPDREFGVVPLPALGHERGILKMNAEVVVPMDERPPGDAAIFGNKKGPEGSDRWPANRVAIHLVSL